MMMESIPSGTILHGRYRIERMLGTGGFGHVYLAVELNSNQQYALKEYFVAGSNGQAQLQHEANVLNQLHHPNLPGFQEAFSEHGHYFVVLSYIEGNDLTDLIRIARQKNEAIPLSLILGWMLSICDAVHFLHSHQPPLIHRDIKPDNIRIIPNGTAVLVDLGNAKAAADGARTLFFIRHQGTPGYAPQEQYPGGTGTTTRSDIYALGGTLYFALTTHEPPNVSVRAQSAQQGLPDLPSLQEQLANNPPDEADTNAVRQFRASGQQNRQGKAWPRHNRHLAQLGTLPPALLDQLNRVIARAMAMRARDRYATVAEFGEDLKRVMAGLPASTLPASPAHRVVDPNSTQPDLPLLVEAFQEAREHAAASAVANPGIPAVPPPLGQPAASASCPRCNAPIIPGSSFCPHCGSVLQPQEKKQSSSEASVTVVRQPTPPPPGRETKRDIALESTIAMRPQRQAAIQTRPAPDSEVAPLHLSSSANRGVVQQSGSVKPPGLQLPSSPAAGGTSRQSRQSGNAPTRPGLLLALILVTVLVVILIVLMIILLISHSHTGNHTAWQFIGREVASYGEGNVSGFLTSSATSFAAGIWACRSGAFAAPGTA